MADGGIYVIASTERASDWAASGIVCGAGGLKSGGSELRSQSRNRIKRNTFSFDYVGQGLSVVLMIGIASDPFVVDNPLLSVQHLITISARWVRCLLARGKG